jgi:hypothetical protein
MSLNFLSKYDDRTAEGILAAAALSTGYFATDLDQPAILKRFSHEAKDVIDEVRSKLRIDRADRSSAAAAAIDKFLAREISDRVLPAGAAQEALDRAGQAGRVPPALYAVLKTKPFLDVFVPLGIRPPHVDDAVKNPDDFQHLLTQRQAKTEKDTLSLFMKSVISANKLPHWLLVQTVRHGLVQNVQCAWRIFPDAVDLSEANVPLDVLKAFVYKFGIPVNLDRGKDSLFVESVILAKERKDFFFSHNSANTDFYRSVSFTTTTGGTIEVGIGYCIDLLKYRRYLVAHRALG